MEHKNKFCILFAGPIGSSKTPITNYLSGKLDLPFINNDFIRREIIEEDLSFNKEKYLKKRDERLVDLFSRGISFIYDASIDREWIFLKKELERFGYSWFIISLDFSKIFLENIYKSKKYKIDENLNRTIEDHKNFLKNYGSLVSISIKDKDFYNRMEKIHKAIIDWIKRMSK